MIRKASITSNVIAEKLKEPESKYDLKVKDIGGGWSLTDNILVEPEYVSQKYEGAGWAGTKYQGAEFSGVSVEAAISF